MGATHSLTRKIFQRRLDDQLFLSGNKNSSKPPENSVFPRAAVCLRNCADAQTSISLYPWRPAVEQMVQKIRDRRANYRQKGRHGDFRGNILGAKPQKRMNSKYLIIPDG